MALFFISNTYAKSYKIQTRKAYVWKLTQKHSPSQHVGHCAKVKHFYCISRTKQTLFHLAFWLTSWQPDMQKDVGILPFLAWTLEHNLFYQFSITMEFQYMSSLTGGLIFLFGLDFTRLSLVLTLFTGLTVCILHLFMIECPASHCLFCGLYGFRCTCTFL